jgi:hypothetical protein
MAFSIDDYNKFAGEQASASAAAAKKTAAYEKDHPTEEQKLDASNAELLANLKGKNAESAAKHQSFLDGQKAAATGATGDYSDEDAFKGIDPKVQVDLIDNGTPVSIPVGDLAGSSLLNDKNAKSQLGMVDPSGAPVSMPVFNVKTALAQGYKLDTTENASVRSDIANMDGVGEGFYQGAKSTVNQFLGGAPELAADYGKRSFHPEHLFKGILPGSPEGDTNPIADAFRNPSHPLAALKEGFDPVDSAHDQKVEAQLEENHPYARAIGGTAGALLSMEAGPLALLGRGASLVGGAAEAATSLGLSKLAPGLAEHLLPAAAKAAEAVAPEAVSAAADVVPSLAEKVVGAGAEAAGEAAAPAASKAVPTAVSSFVERTAAFLPKAAGIAAEGATYAAPDAAIKAANGDYAGAAESLAAGGALNLVLHGTINAGSKIRSLLGDAETSTSNFGENLKSSLKESADYHEIKSLGMTEKEASMLSKGNRKFITENKLAPEVGEDAGDYLNRVKADSKSTNEQLNQLYKDLPDPVVARKDFFERLGKVAEAVGADERNLFQKKAIENNWANKLKVLEENYPQENLSLSNLRAIRQNLDTQVSWADPEGKALSSMFRKMRFETKDTLLAEGQKYAESIGKPEFAKKFEELNRASSAYMDLEEIAKKRVFKREANRSSGLIAQNAGNAAGIAGAYLGSHLGPVGGLIGGAVGRFAGKGLSKYSSANYHRFMSSAMSQAAESNFGILAVNKSLNHLAENVASKVPALFQASKIATQAGREPTLDRINGLIGYKKHDDQTQAFNDLHDHLTEPKYVENHHVNENLDEFSSTIDKTGGSGVGSKFASQMSSNIQCLRDELPKSPVNPNPLAVQDHKISQYEMSKFLDKAEVVNNPYSILDRVRDKTLSSDDIRLVKKQYPQLMTVMQSSVLEHIQKNPELLADLTPGAMSKISQFLELPQDNNVSFFQSIGQQQQGGGNGSGAPPSVKGGKPIDLPSFQTPGQKLAGK